MWPGYQDDTSLPRHAASDDSNSSQQRENFDNDTWSPAAPSMSMQQSNFGAIPSHHVPPHLLSLFGRSAIDPLLTSSLSPLAHPYLPSLPMMSHPMSQVPFMPSQFPDFPHGAHGITGPQGRFPGNEAFRQPLPYYSPHHQAMLRYNKNRERRKAKRPGKRSNQEPPLRSHRSQPQQGWPSAHTGDVNSSTQQSNTRTENLDVLRQVSQITDVEGRPARSKTQEHQSHEIPDSTTGISPASDGGFVEKNQNPFSAIHPAYIGAVRFPLACTVPASFLQPSLYSQPPLLYTSPTPPLLSHVSPKPGQPSSSISSIYNPSLVHTQTSNSHASMTQHSSADNPDLQPGGVAFERVVEDRCLSLRYETPRLESNNLTSNRIDVEATETAGSKYVHNFSSARTKPRVTAGFKHANDLSSAHTIATETLGFKHVNELSAGTIARETANSRHVNGRQKRSETKGKRDPEMTVSKTPIHLRPSESKGTSNPEKIKHKVGSKAESMVCTKTQMQENNDPESRPALSHQQSDSGNKPLYSTATDRQVIQKPGSVGGSSGGNILCSFPSIQPAYNSGTGLSQADTHTITISLSASIREDVSDDLLSERGEAIKISGPRHVNERQKRSETKGKGNPQMTFSGTSVYQGSSESKETSNFEKIKHKAGSDAESTMCTEKKMKDKHDPARETAGSRHVTGRQMRSDTKVKRDPGMRVSGTTIYQESAGSKETSNPEKIKHKAGSEVESTVCAKTQNNDPDSRPEFSHQQSVSGHKPLYSTAINCHVIQKPGNEGRSSGENALCSFPSTQPVYSSGTVLSQADTHTISISLSASIREDVSDDLLSERGEAIKISGPRHVHERQKRSETKAMRDPEITVSRSPVYQGSSEFKEISNHEKLKHKAGSVAESTMYAEKQMKDNHDPAGEAAGSKHASDLLAACTVARGTASSRHVHGRQKVSEMKGKRDPETIVSGTNIYQELADSKTSNPEKTKHNVCSGVESTVCTETQTQDNNDPISRSALSHLHSVSGHKPLYSTPIHHHFTQKPESEGGSSGINVLCSYPGTQFACNIGTSLSHTNTNTVTTSVPQPSFFSWHLAPCTIPVSGQPLSSVNDVSNAPEPNTQSSDNYSALRHPSTSLSTVAPPAPILPFEKVMEDLCSTLRHKTPKKLERTAQRVPDQHYSSEASSTKPRKIDETFSSHPAYGGQTNSKARITSDPSSIKSEVNADHKPKMAIDTAGEKRGNCNETLGNEILKSEAHIKRESPECEEVLDHKLQSLTHVDHNKPYGITKAEVDEKPNLDQCEGKPEKDDSLTGVISDETFRAIQSTSVKQTSSESEIWCETSYTQSVIRKHNYGRTIMPMPGKTCADLENAQARSMLKTQEKDIETEKLEQIKLQAYKPVHAVSQDQIPSKPQLSNAVGTTDGNRSVCNSSTESASGGSSKETVGVPRIPQAARTIDTKILIREGGPRPSAIEDTPTQEPSTPSNASAQGSALIDASDDISSLPQPTNSALSKQCPSSEGHMLYTLRETAPSNALSDQNVRDLYSEEETSLEVSAQLHKTHNEDSPNRKTKGNTVPSCNQRPTEETSSSEVPCSKLDSRSLLTSCASSNVNPAIKTPDEVTGSESSILKEETHEPLITQDMFDVNSNTLSSDTVFDLGPVADIVFRIPEIPKRVRKSTSPEKVPEKRSKRKRAKHKYFKINLSESRLTSILSGESQSDADKKTAASESLLRWPPVNGDSNQIGTDQTSSTRYSTGDSHYVQQMHHTTPSSKNKRGPVIHKTRNPMQESGGRSSTQGLTSAETKVNRSIKDRSSGLGQTSDDKFTRSCLPHLGVSQSTWSVTDSDVAVDGRHAVDEDMGLQRKLKPEMKSTPLSNSMQKQKPQLRKRSIAPVQQREALSETPEKKSYHTTLTQPIEKMSTVQEAPSKDHTDNSFIDYPDGTLGKEQEQVHHKLPSSRNQNESVTHKKLKPGQRKTVPEVRNTSKNRQTEKPQRRKRVITSLQTKESTSVIPDKISCHITPMQPTDEMSRVQEAPSNDHIHNNSFTDSPNRTEGIQVLNEKEPEQQNAAHVSTENSEEEQKFDTNFLRKYFYTKSTSGSLQRDPMEPINLVDSPEEVQVYPVQKDKRNISCAKKLYMPNQSYVPTSAMTSKSTISTSKKDYDVDQVMPVREEMNANLHETNVICAFSNHTSFDQTRQQNQDGTNNFVGMRSAKANVTSSVHTGRSANIQQAHRKGEIQDERTSWNTVAEFLKFSEGATDDEISQTSEASSLLTSAKSIQDKTEVCSELYGTYSEDVSTKQSGIIPLDSSSENTSDLSTRNIFSRFSELIDSLTETAFLDLNQDVKTADMKTYPELLSTRASQGSTILSTDMKEIESVCKESMQNEASSHWASETQRESRAQPKEDHGHWYETPNCLQTQTNEVQTTDARQINCLTNLPSTALGTQVKAHAGQSFKTLTDENSPSTSVDTIYKATRDATKTPRHSGLRSSRSTHSPLPGATTEMKENTIQPDFQGNQSRNADKEDQDYSLHINWDREDAEDGGINIHQDNNSTTELSRFWRHTSSKRQELKEHEQPMFLTSSPSIMRSNKRPLSTSFHSDRKCPKDSRRTSPTWLSDHPGCELSKNSTSWNQSSTGPNFPSEKGNDSFNKNSSTDPTLSENMKNPEEGKKNQDRGVLKNIQASCKTQGSQAETFPQNTQPAIRININISPFPKQYSDIQVPPCNVDITATTTNNEKLTSSGCILSHAGCPVDDQGTRTIKIPNCTAMSATEENMHFTGCSSPGDEQIISDKGSKTDNQNREVSQNDADMFSEASCSINNDMVALAFTEKRKACMEGAAPSQICDESMSDLEKTCTDNDSSHRVLAYSCKDEKQIFNTLSVDPKQECRDLSTPDFSHGVIQQISPANESCKTSCSKCSPGKTEQDHDCSNRQERTHDLHSGESSSPRANETKPLRETTSKICQGKKSEFINLLIDTSVFVDQCSAKEQEILDSYTLHKLPVDESGESLSHTKDTPEEGMFSGAAREVIASRGKKMPLKTQDPNIHLNTCAPGANILVTSDSHRLSKPHSRSTKLKGAKRSKSNAKVNTKRSPNPCHFQKKLSRKVSEEPQFTIIKNRNLQACKNVPNLTSEIRDIKRFVVIKVEDTAGAYCPDLKQICKNTSADTGTFSVTDAAPNTNDFPYFEEYYQSENERNPDNSMCEVCECEYSGSTDLHVTSERHGFLVDSGRLYEDLDKIIASVGDIERFVCNVALHHLAHLVPNSSEVYENSLNTKDAQLMKDYKGTNNNYSASGLAVQTEKQHDENDVEDTKTFQNFISETRCTEGQHVSSATLPKEDRKDSLTCAGSILVASVSSGKNSPVNANTIHSKNHALSIRNNELKDTKIEVTCHTYCRPPVRGMHQSKCDQKIGQICSERKPNITSKRQKKKKCNRKSPYKRKEPPKHSVSHEKSQGIFHHALNFPHKSQISSTLNTSDTVHDVSKEILLDSLQTHHDTRTPRSSGRTKVATSFKQHSPETFSPAEYATLHAFIDALSESEQIKAMASVNATLPMAEQHTDEQDVPNKVELYRPGGNEMSVGSNFGTAENIAMDSLTRQRNEALRMTRTHSLHLAELSVTNRNVTCKDSRFLRSSDTETTSTAVHGRHDADHETVPARSSRWQHFETTSHSFQSDEKNVRDSLTESTYEHSRINDAWMLHSINSEWQCDDDNAMLYESSLSPPVLSLTPLSPSPSELNDEDDDVDYGEPPELTPCASK